MLVLPSMMTLVAATAAMKQDILSNILAGIPLCKDSSTLHMQYAKPVIDGKYLSKELAEHAPQYTIEGDSSKWYSIVMIDVDAPNPANPTSSPYLHYILENIKADDPAHFDVIEEYAAVTPPEGKHRYVSLLLEQRGNIAPSGPLTSSRRGFDVLGYVHDKDVCIADSITFISSPSRRHERHAP
ncbi:hypothetical protein AeMF1_001354 [Aphanomyces euteiches]|nr:hypothetical protein AeMF1_001354 [Aphanomyces euteiches]KAH9193635.1 hypothetical protein AeNC1_004375 [Aphanomyces euteiches]